MNKWFEEKTPQLSSYSLTAFGIDLMSRYGKAQEMIEMIEFASAVARADLETYVLEVFYDSKSCCCSFKLKEGIEEFGPVSTHLLALGRLTISQFEWFGYIEHGRGTQEEE